MSLLTVDSTRKVNSPLPYQRPITLQELYKGGRYDTLKVIQFLQREGRLSKKTLLEIIRRANKVLKMEPNLITVTGEVWVIGDIHGQFYDLARLCGKIDMQSDKAVFLGDYVDRGSFSIEVIVTLLVWKLDRPGKVILLRGNHECQQMTSYFNFHQECLQKYDQEVYQTFLDLFNAFPLAATINQTFLCLHGGLSLNISKANDISRIDRFHEIPSNGLFCDLVWADPTLQLNGEVKGGQIQNVERGCSFIFGREVTEQVLRESRVRCLVRGHQAEEEGYRLFSWDGKDQFPLVMTVFSAPNYCDFYNNKGACIRITEKSVQIQQYSWTQHPFLLPDFMDTFEWSFPFVAQKVGEMMFHLLQPDRNTEQEEIDLTLIRKLEIMRSILATHRNQADSNITYTHLDGRSLDNMLAHDQQAIKCIKNSRPDNFQAKRSIDLKYQKRPSSDIESPDI